MKIPQSTRKRILVVSEGGESRFLDALAGLGLNHRVHPRDLTADSLAGHDLMIAEGTRSVVERLAELQKDGANVPLIVSDHPANGGAVSTSSATLKTVAVLPSEVDREQCLEALASVLEFTEEDDAVRTLVKRVDRALERLSAGQVEVLELLLRGRSNKQVAAELNVGLRTVEARRARCMEIFEARSFAEMIGETTLHHYFTGNLPKRAWRLLRSEHSQKDLEAGSS